ncbi:MAG: hypothetical protein Q7J31_18315, partial [Syntrophales bacterium]|nr:hypothetical protein [Syntrophales bacterium]
LPESQDIVIVGKNGVPRLSYRDVCRELEFLITPMPGASTTKDENHPHPSLPRRGGGIQGGGIFI